MRKYFIIIILVMSAIITNAQQQHYCGADIYDHILSQDIDFRIKQNQIEEKYQSSYASTSTTKKILLDAKLPIVFQVVQDNPTVDITEVTLVNTLERLNQAFKNVAPFYSDLGIDTHIDFCLVQRNEDADASTGIERYQSPFTDMSLTGSFAYLRDLQKNPKDRIYVQIVDNACLGADCNMAGFATQTGIVLDADIFNSSLEAVTVLVHEMGHFLGLKHTFQGGCKNDDCLADGDRVCDTPPDNRTLEHCFVSSNSCSSDEDDSTNNNPFRSVLIGGIGDQNDLHTNYMDYNWTDCRLHFTQGQSDRMHFFIDELYNSLSNSTACLAPCEQEVVADFSVTDSVEVGSILTAQNLSINASEYNWYINGTFISTDVDLSFQVLDQGSVEIRLEVISSDTLCSTDQIVRNVMVYCSTNACFDYNINEQYIVYQDCSENADQLQWNIINTNQDTLATSVNALDSFYVNNVDFLQICLLASNTFCEVGQCKFITITTDGSEICDNEQDDDDDGLVDLFDPDCPCDDTAYQAQCPTDCEIVPDAFSSIKMKMKWETIPLSLIRFSPSTYVSGDINDDNNIELVTLLSRGGLNNTKNYFSIFNAENGNLIDTVRIFKDYSFFEIVSHPSIARDKNTNKVRISTMSLQDIVSHDITGNQLFRTSYPINYPSNIIGNADFDNDGKYELYSGSVIFNGQTGEVLFTGKNQECKNVNCRGVIPVVADVIGNDNRPELITGKYIYDLSLNNLTDTIGNTVNIYEAPTGISDGKCSVADMNGDGKLEVIVIQSVDSTNGFNGKISIYDPRTMVLLADKEISSVDAVSGGGIPLIIDINNDCIPEIAVVFGSKLNVYKLNNTPILDLVYSISTSDDFGITGLTSFDLNQDGYTEIIYRDDTSLRIINAQSGITLDSVTIYSSTSEEYPIILDVDNNGTAEIVVSGNLNVSDETKLYCFESALAPWAPARSVWNQYSYNPTQVNDDLTIPRYPQNPAQPLQGTENCPRETCNTPYNNFMVQATYRTQEGCYVWPDDSCNEEICDNGQDDDDDGLVDLFDPDCPCDDTAYQAQCPTDCEIVPDAFSSIKMKMKWQSEVLESSIFFNSDFQIFDNSSGNIEIVSSQVFDRYESFTYTIDSVKLIRLDAINGAILQNKAIDNISIDSEFAVLDPLGMGDRFFYFTQDEKLIAFNNSLDEVFKSDSLFSKTDTPPYVTDLDQNGIAEVFLQGIVYNSRDGNILLKLPQGACNFGANGCIAIPVIADFLDDPGLEVAMGNKIYGVNLVNLSDTLGNTYTEYSAPPLVTDGFTSAGDIDMDGKLDVIVVTDRNRNGGGIYVWNPRNSSMIATAESGDDGGVAFIGDVDGDCSPEIGMTFKNELRIYKYDGTADLKLMWEIPTSDKSGRTGVTMFDFNQDGMQELIYRDEDFLRIIEGDSGHTIDSFNIVSPTGIEYPVIADIDKDGQAEILVTGHENDPSKTRIYCFESALAPWAPARSVWNQFSYNPTQVNDDLTIPRYPQNPAQPLQGTENCPRETCNTPYNNFMVQATYRTQEGCYVWPSEEKDLSITGEIKCVGDSLEICVYTQGATDEDFMQGIDLGCYFLPLQNNPILSETVREDSSCFKIANTISFDSIALVINDSATGVVFPPNLPNTTFTECDYTNNAYLLKLESPDFSIDIVDTECTTDSLIFYIATDNIGLDTGTDCIGAGCYFISPANPMTGIDPQQGLLELTSWCFDYDSTAMMYQYLDTFRVAIPVSGGISEMWWTINEGGFGPGLYSSEITGIYECNYDNNIDSVSFDLSIRVLDLGPDITKCGSEIFTLNAGSGFASYLWNDLSTDSIYSEVAEGLHYIEALDFCGRIYRDTIQVTIDHTEEVDLGPDQTLCAEEELTLTINQAYERLEWFPPEAIDCDTCNSITVSSDTSLMVVVRARNGDCVSLDSIYIERVIPIQDSINMTICEGEIYPFFGDSLSTTGIYQSLSADCSTLSTVSLEVHPIDTTDLQIQICAGDSILFGNGYLHTTGDYQNILPNQYLCDSLLLLALEVVNQISQDDTITICEGDSVMIFDNWVSSAGTFDQQFTSVSGCDSTQQYTVNLDPLLYGSISYDLCPGDSVLVMNQWFDEETLLMYSKENMIGCDSIIDVDIRIVDSYEIYDTIQLCTGDTINVFGFSVSEEMDLSETIMATNGCDSTLYVHVAELSILSSEEAFLLCPGDSILVDNLWYNTSDTISSSNSSSAGCDSIHTVMIKVLDDIAAPTLTIDCATNEIVASIEAPQGWEILWDNGDTTPITSYMEGSEGMLSMFYGSDCIEDFLFDLPLLADSSSIIPYPDTNISLGEEIIIEIDIDLEYWTWSITPSDIIDCENCSSISILPLEDTEVFINYMHATGCIYEQSFTISVATDINDIYIPNAFSPNEDGYNDSWQIYNGEDIEIISCNIYDRWGNMVYNVENGLIDWDGNFKGKALNPGVFVYQLVYIDKLGKQVIKTGDLTLIK